MAKRALLLPTERRRPYAVLPHTHYILCPPRPSHSGSIPLTIQA